MCVGLKEVLVPPSPKFQLFIAGTGAVVLVNLMGVFTHTVAGTLKSVASVPITTAAGRTSVSVHPEALDRMSVTS